MEIGIEITRITKHRIAITDKTNGYRILSIHKDDKQKDVTAFYKYLSDLEANTSDPQESEKGGEG